MINLDKKTKKITIEIPSEKDIMMIKGSSGKRKFHRGIAELNGEGAATLKFGRGKKRFTTSYKILARFGHPTLVMYNHFYRGGEKYEIYDDNDSRLFERGQEMYRDSHPTTSPPQKS